MGRFGERRTHSATLTPTEGSKFKFPPDVCSSADRLRDISNIYNHPRRNFTPSRNALYMNSPDISPINPSFEFNFKRMSPEKIRKAKADTTVHSTGDITIDEDFILMPPPVRRKSAGSGNNSASLEYHVRQRRLEPSYSPFGNTGRRNVRKPQKKPTQSAPSQHDVLNAPLSLPSLLFYTGLDRYIEIFEKKEIDLEVLLVMDDSDLMGIGIDNVKDREAILKFKELFYTTDS